MPEPDGPKQRDELARLDPQVDAVQRRVTAEGFGKLPDLDGHWEEGTVVQDAAESSASESVTGGEASSSSIPTGQWSDPVTSGRMNAARRRGRSAADTRK